jgi:hypothetical protein
VVVATTFVVLRQTMGSGGGGTAPQTPAGARTSGGDSGVGDLRLELLDKRSDDVTPERNLFRFESRRSAAPAAPRGPSRAVEIPVAPASLPGPPPPPPIPLRYIGYVDQAGEVPRVGVLSDGRGNVFNGKEGDIIEGRYRVVRIGTDSAELIYVDGRGRQTIRLSGQ